MKSNDSGGHVQCFPPTRRRHPIGYLVVLGGGHQEEDGGDRVEAFEPAPPLRPLTPNVHHLERYIPDLKVILVDALGGLAGQQDVLLTGNVVL